MSGLGLAATADVDLEGRVTNCLKVLNRHFLECES